MSSPKASSKKWLAIGAVVLVAVVGIVAAILFERERKKKEAEAAAASGGSAMALSAAPMNTGYAVQPSAVSTANRTPDLSTERGANSLYDLNGLSPSGAQPIEADYSSGTNLRQDAPDDQWAPVSTMSANEALSLANPDNAQWFSQNLLPNAELNCSRDGMITDGPTFEELAIYTPRLLEAAAASRFFMEPPQLRSRSGSDLRPTPMISASAGSRESIPWGISSIQQSDVALDNAARIRAFCV